MARPAAAFLARLLSSDMVVVPLLLGLGALMRIAYVLGPGAGRHAEGEAMNAAIHFARTGVIGGAYRMSDGATAHLLPIPIVAAGTVYRLLGVQSAASEAILAAVSIGLVLASFAFLYWAFAELGAPRLARVGALAFLCLAPINVSLETIVYRIWEGAYAVSLAAAFLVAVLKLDRSERIGPAAIVGMTAAAAVLFFISPQLGVGAYACAFLLMIRRIRPLRWPAVALSAAAALALLLVPWHLRNQRALGESILLRSNFGLELALAYHAGAMDADERQAFLDRLEEIHPFESDSAHAAMVAAGGEAAYARALGAEAKAWIAEHPAETVYLAGKHIAQFFFPPAWQWNVYSDAGVGLDAKLALNWLTSLLGLAGAVLAALRLGRRYHYALLMLAVPVLPYLLVQPILRYKYIVFGLLLFFAFDVCARITVRSLGWPPMARLARAREADA